MPTENANPLGNPTSDATALDSVFEDRIEETKLPEDIDQSLLDGDIYPGSIHQAWQDSCSEFILPLSSCPPRSKDENFTIPSTLLYRQADCALTCIRRWSVTTAPARKLAETLIKKITVPFFEHDVSETYCFRGTPAVAVGISVMRTAQEESRRKRRNKKGMDRDLSCVAS